MVFKMKREVSKEHVKRIKEMTNDRCIFEWDNNLHKFVVKEKVKRAVKLADGIIGIQTFYMQVFPISGPNGEYAPISDAVYRELWKKNKDNYDRHAAKRIVKEVYERNESIKEKKKQSALDELKIETRNILKGRKVFV